MNKITNHGFIAPTIQPEDYVFGSYNAKQEVLQPNGQWDWFLPPIELQSRGGLETMACTVFGSQTAVQMIADRKYRIKQNFSERFTGTLAGISRYGGSPHKACEVMRKTGLISDRLLPFSDDIDTWEEFYAPISKGHLRVGKDWLDSWDFKHEYVFTGGRLEDKQNLLMLALIESPIALSVLAWQERNGLYYKDKGQQDNHWCVLYGYIEDKHWKIYDTYDKTCKELEWSYDFGFAKKFSIKKKPQKRSWFGHMIRIFK